MAWPSDVVRTKNWGNEVLTDSDLEGQLDLIIAWLDAFADETSGHDHTGTSNKGIKIALTTAVSGTLPATNGGTGTATVTQGDIIYGSASNVWSKLAAGTSGYFLKTQGAGANPTWALLSKDIGARVYNSANISIPDTTATILTFDSERYDTDTIHSVASATSKLVATTAGKYHIFAHIQFAGNGTGTRLVEFLLNGSTIIARQYGGDVAGSSGIVWSLSTIWNMSANDYVEVRVTQTSGGNLNVLANSAYSPEFGMSLVV